MLGITRRAAVLGAAADGHPARLFRGGEPGFCLPSVAEALRVGALWQDAAGGTPAAVGAPVGTVGFTAGLSSVASQGTATKRPLLTTDSKSIPLLRFDGLDDCLVTPSIDFSACDAVTVIAGLRTAVETTAATVCEHGVVLSPGAFGLFAPVNSSNNHIYMQTRGDADGGWYYDIPAGSSSVFASVLVGSETTRIAKVPAYALNGNSLAARYAGGADDPIGAGAFQNAALNIGQRNASVYAFSGDLYSLTVIGRRLSNAEMLATSRWINEQMGRVY